MAGTIYQQWNLGSLTSPERDELQKKSRHRHRRSYDLLWKEFFRDPSQWWDNRTSKLGPTYPDFKHRATKETLWIDHRLNPSWVVEELRRRQLSSQDVALCVNTEKMTLDNTPLRSKEVADFVGSLKECTKNKDLRRGSKVHDDIVKRGLLDKCLDALVPMYAKCGALAKAYELLDTHESRNVVSWTSLIAGYARQGQGRDALICFDRMQREGLSPDAVTFTCVLKACGSLKAADKGEQIHEEISRQGLLGSDIVLGNALVDMYAKCGVLEKAQRVLDELPSRDVVTWNTLITGYAQKGQGEQALNCFERMKSEGLSPDPVTFAGILKACGIIKAADKGEQIHDEIARQGLLGNNIFLGNALVDMYAKCGDLAKARQVLEKLPSRDVVSWTALITRYAQQGQADEALNCLKRMQRDGLSPNGRTFACILKACGTIGAADKGRRIHDEITRQGLLKNDIVLGNALVDMYAKCGALAKAQQVLDELPSRDVVSWNTLMAGYAQQGQDEKVLSCFEQMQREGLSPDAMTFSCVLNACNQLGLVEDGHMHFANMSTKYGMKPDLEHYACMVALFGRSGHLNKAVGVVQEMPSSDYPAVWSALLGACQKWGDVNVGRWAFEQAVQVDKSDSAAYVLMANIYAAAGMQEDAENITAMGMKNKAWKKPRRS